MELIFVSQTIPTTKFAYPTPDDIKEKIIEELKTALGSEFEKKTIRISNITVNITDVNTTD